MSPDAIDVPGSLAPVTVSKLIIGRGEGTLLGDADGPGAVAKFFFTF
jgi:hypothetical protein